MYIQDTTTKSYRFLVWKPQLSLGKGGRGGEYNHIEMKHTGNNNPYIQDIDLVDMRQSY